jgi:hypothetical protein
VKQCCKAESQSLTSLAGTIKCTMSVTPEAPSSTLQLIGATTHALVVLPHTPTVCVIAFCGSRGQSTSAKSASAMILWMQEQERFATKQRGTGVGRGEGNKMRSSACAVELKYPSVCWTRMQARSYPRDWCRIVQIQARNLRSVFQVAVEEFSQVMRSNLT